MPKNICIIYTETNGLHQLDEPVTKKNIFGFARLVCLNYIIGYRKDGKFKELKKVREILTPKCINFEEDAVNFHGITQKKAEEKGIDSKIIIKNLADDLKNVQVIVSHNLPFHLRALHVECFRTSTYINFNNYILIDTISFYHDFGFLNLLKLANKIFDKSFSKKKPKDYTKVIRKIFIELYNRYEKKIKLKS